MENNPLSNKKYKLLSTFYAEATPIKNLTIRSQLSADYGHTTSFYRSFPSYKPNNNYGGAQRSSYDMLNLMITNTANYRFMLNDVHSFNFMVGQEGVDYHYEGFQVTTRGQTNDILTNLSSGSTASSWGDPVTEYSFLSFLVVVNIIMMIVTMLTFRFVGMDLPVSEQINIGELFGQSGLCGISVRRSSCKI